MLDFYQSFAQNQLLKLFERIISCPDVKKLDQLIFVPKMVELLDVPELSKSTKETCIEIVMGFFEMLNSNFVDSNNGFVTSVILSILIKVISQFIGALNMVTFFCTLSTDSNFFITLQNFLCSTKLVLV